MSHHATSSSLSRKVGICVAMLSAIVLLAASPLHEWKLAASQSPEVPVPLEARVLVPVTGNKTTLRFQVINRGKGTSVYPAFINSTKLRVTGPDGKVQELAAMAENASREGLASGETRSWDRNIADMTKLAAKGEYRIGFIVNGVRSNEVVFVVDEAGKE